MDASLFIPNIVEKIEDVLNKLQLVPEAGPQEFINKTDGKKHRYSSACADKTGGKIMFYARMYKSLFDKKRMLNEILLGRFFTKSLSLNAFPEYFDSKAEKDFEWITREYFSVSPLEEKKHIERIRKKLSDSDISNIAEKLWQMNNLSVSSLNFLEKFDIEEYLRLPEKISDEKIIPETEIKYLENIIKENETVLETENRYFCHGDFHIGNIIVSKKTMKFVDLESVYINNFAFDIAFLTTRLWQHRNERKKLINSYAKTLPADKKKIFPSLFRIDAAYIGYKTFGSRPAEYSPKKINERQLFYKKLINAAAKSFEDLTNL